MTAKTLPLEIGWMGDRTRGASLGRPSHAGPYDGHKLTLQRIRLDSGGYDSGGAYWGIGAPLYWCASDDGTIDMFFRAASRDKAKEHVRVQYPTVRFYR
jgi:hypothetical protein